MSMFLRPKEHQLPPSLSPATYDSSSQYFAIKLHHGGSFYTNHVMEYVGADFEYFDRCHPDEISLIELHSMAKLLGYRMVHNFYFKTTDGLKVLKTDLEVMGLVKFVDKDNVEEVYCDHGTEFFRNRQVDSNVVFENITLRDGVFRVEVDEGSGDVELSSSSDSEYEHFSDSDDGFVHDEELIDINVMSDDVIKQASISSEVSKMPFPVNAVELDSILQSGYASSDDLKSLPNSSDDEDGSMPKTNFPTFNEKTDMTHLVFKLGMKFSSGDSFKDAIREYYVKVGKEISFPKSAKDRIRAVCRDGCTWSIYARKMQNENSFQIVTFEDKHKCNRVFKNKNVSVKLIVRKYLERIRMNPTWPVVSFRDTVEKELNAKVTRSTAYRALKRALNAIEGTVADQYKLLWDYAEELRRTNIGTTIILQVKSVGSSLDKKQFKRIYICWGALRKGFLEGCRPVIGLDGCHLKGPYKGILLTAVGIDANNCMYPFAYAVVEKETEDSWSWFIALLRDDIGIVNESAYTFISDKQKGLVQAMEKILGNAEHRFCVRHLYNNFKSAHKGQILKDLLWKAARASTMASFSNAMNELRSVNESAYQWLNEKDPIHWSKSHFMTFSKCDLLLNNLCESFNAAIVKARDRGIISMLESIRIYLMETVVKKRDAMKRKQGAICPKIQEKLEIIKEEASSWIARWNGDKKFEVHGPYGQQFEVDIEKGICGCRLWELTGIPCRHVVACVNFLDEEPEKYVHICYFRDTFLLTYNNPMDPIKGKELWPKTRNPIILPLLMTRQPGRPKKFRRREADEVPIEGAKLSRKGMAMTCKICGIKGHNRRSCKTIESNTNGAATNKNSEPSEAPAGKRKKLVVKKNASVVGGSGGDTSSATVCPIGAGNLDISVNKTQSSQISSSAHAGIMQPKEKGFIKTGTLSWRGQRLLTVTNSMEARRKKKKDP